MKRKRALVFAGRFLFLSFVILAKSLSFALVEGKSAARFLAEKRRGVTQNHLRVAIVGFVRTAGKSRAFDDLENTISSALGQDERIALIDRSLFEPALAGIGYDGSINMTIKEARGIGAAIGCDFFITGKAETLTRSERRGESHEEATVGVMIVDGRSGSLAAFDLINEKATSMEAAASEAEKTLARRAVGYVDKMIEFRSARFARPSESSREQIEEMPDEGSPVSEGFTPPEFLNRVKPEYTDEADQADISATVEAMAVFKADGQVGDVEVTRWAGFGLDGSAERAIRSLKFKPATRDGQPVSVRAMVRYNFRRVAESDAQSNPSDSTNKPQ